MLFLINPSALVFQFVVGLLVIHHFHPSWLVATFFGAAMLHVHLLSRLVLKVGVLLEDLLVVRFLALEMKFGLTEADLVAALERRLKLVDRESARAIWKRHREKGLRPFEEIMAER